MENQYEVTTFYHFVDMNENRMAQIEKGLLEFSQSHELKGLVLLASEGINSTLCAPSGKLSAVKDFVDHFFGATLFFKDSTCAFPAFRRLAVKRKSEIVTTTRPDLTPDASQNSHLSPSEWNRVLKEEDVFLVDTRNWYETEIGTFKNAIDPKIEQFTEFPEFMKQQNLPKDKKILMFCTGGIRCEKGILDLQDEGYTNVFQLEGGIINYLKEYPNDEFDGECFVFDNRVALTQDLKPTSHYELCPYTGQPGDVEIECVRCGTHKKISKKIFDENSIRSQTCSKNCAYHWELNPGRKGTVQNIDWERPAVFKSQIKSEG